MKVTDQSKISIDLEFMEKIAAQIAVFSRLTRVLVDLRKGGHLSDYAISKLNVVMDEGLKVFEGAKK